MFGNMFSKLENIIDKYRPGPNAVDHHYGKIEAPEYSNSSNVVSYYVGKLLSNFGFTYSQPKQKYGGPIIHRTTLYDLGGNDVRDHNGNVVAVQPSLLGYHDPTREEGTPRVDTASVSLPTFVANSVEGHELGHAGEHNASVNLPTYTTNSSDTIIAIHNEDENRANDRAKDRAHYEYMWQD